MSLFLIGFRHSNQSSVGKMLSEKIHWRFIDFDNYTVEIDTDGDGASDVTLNCTWSTGLCA